MAKSLQRKGCCTKWVFENGGPEPVPPGNGSSSVEQLYRPAQELHRPARDSKNDYIIIASNEIGVKYKETDHIARIGDAASQSGMAIPGERHQDRRSANT